MPDSAYTITITHRALPLPPTVPTYLPTYLLQGSLPSHLILARRHASHAPVVTNGSSNGLVIINAGAEGLARPLFLLSICMR